jgi:hypothetical protein
MLNNDKNFYCDGKVYVWSQIHDHYTAIKKQYSLTVTDIIKQCGEHPYSYMITYMCSTGRRRQPSTKKNTCGRHMWDFAIKNLKKNDWGLSSMSYEEKLNEMSIEGRFYGMDVYFFDKPHDPKIPELIVTLNNDNGAEPYVNEEYIQYKLTIDGIVPIIREIRRSYNLVYSEII